jgi:molybdopterin molybdotransferase
MLEQCGVVSMTGHCRDDAKSLEKIFRAATKNEILIVTGGVSVGEHDLVPQTLRRLGAKIDIWRVAIKPGKPFLFGQLKACLVFGLPGNPVSAFVTFLQFVRPAILKMMGARDVDLQRLPARLAVDIESSGDRAHYVRGQLEGGNFTPIGRQESHALFGLSEANALLRVGVGELLKAGKVIEVQVWD